MNLILKKSNELFSYLKEYEKKNNRVPEDWQGIVTVAAGAIEDPKNFQEAVDPLIKWLAENNHPHVTAIVTSTGAELVEGIESHQTTEFLLG